MSSYITSHIFLKLNIELQHKRGLIYYVDSYMVMKRRNCTNLTLSEEYDVPN